MQLSHDPMVIDAVFDEPNLVSCAGLAPVMALAERAGLSELVAEHVRLTGEGAAAPAVKVSCLVGGMVAGADSIEDLDLLRHGAMGRLFAGLRAPTTLGTFLRCFTHGHVRQLAAVASRFLVGLCRNSPVLAGAEHIAYVDLDDTIRQVYGYAKQGAAFGYTKVKGLDVQLATISTPRTAPVVAAAALRKGSAAGVRGAARMIGEVLGTARACGADPAAGAVVTVRADSGFFSYGVVAAARRGGARFSVTARMNPKVRAAISTIGQEAWTPIHYPEAFVDEETGQLVSDAEVAEVEFTAFTSRRKAEHVTARLIVRRVKRLNPKTVPQDQDELFSVYRFHAVFTDSPLDLIEAELAHRRHAIVEKVIEDVKNSALAHLPSGSFAANAAWLACAVMAFNLTRAAGAIAGTLFAKARTATIRAKLICVPARLARGARRLTLHLPTQWPWQGWLDLLMETCLRPPTPAAA